MYDCLILISKRAKFTNWTSNTSSIFPDIIEINSSIYCLKKTEFVNFSWKIKNRKYILINFNLLKQCSPNASVIDMVRYNLYGIFNFGLVESSSNVFIAFKTQVAFCIHNNFFIFLGIDAHCPDHASLSIPPPLDT